MNTITASDRTRALITLFDLQTLYFKRALDGIPDQDMYKRLNTEANHMAWLTGSLVQQRFMMSSESKAGIKQTGDDLFKNNKGIQAGVTYPTIAEYLADWEKISPIAREVVVTIDDKKLDSELDMGGMKMSYYDLISFFSYREASIIGQLALWRRLLGHPALKYDD